MLPVTPFTNNALDGFSKGGHSNGSVRLRPFRAYLRISESGNSGISVSLGIGKSSDSSVSISLRPFRAYLRIGESGNSGVSVSLRRAKFVYPCRLLSHTLICAHSQHEQFIKAIVSTHSPRE